MKQTLVAIDQVLNTLTYAKGEGFGKADETLSARMFRLGNKPRWNFAMDITNKIFFWQKDHCFEAYLSEVNRNHLPRHYRK